MSLLKKIEHFRVKEDENRLISDNSDIKMQPKVFDVLVILSRHQGNTVSRKQLIKEVWNGHSEIGDAALTSAIYAIRKVFKDKPNAISTISKKGYKLNLSVHFEEQNSGKKFSKHLVLISLLAFVLVAIGIFELKGVLLGDAIREQPPKVHFLAPHPVTYFEGREDYPDVSADGKKLVYSWEKKGSNSNIFIQSLDDTSKPLLQLSDESGSDYSPVFSPDSTKVAFVRVTKSRCKIILKDLLSFDESTLGDCYFEKKYRILDWSPSGKLIAYITLNQKSNASVFLYNTETGSKHEILKPSSIENDRTLSWASNSDELIIVRESKAQNLVYRFSSDLKPSILMRSDEQIYSVAWSKDDLSIYLTMLKNQKIGISQFDIGSKAIQEVFHDDTPLNLTTAHENQGEIIYSKFEAKEQISTIPIECAKESGCPLTPLISSSHRNLYASYNKAIGRYIFISDRTGSFEVWSASLKGTNTKKVTDNSGLSGIPSWAVDSDAFVATFQVEGGLDQLFRGSEASTQLQRIISDSYDYKSPIFTEKNKLQVTSNRSGQWELWSLSLDSSSFSQLTDDHGRFGRLSEDKEYLYYSRENKRGIWRKALNSGIVDQINSELEPSDWGNFLLWKNSIMYVYRSNSDQIIKQSIDKSKREVLYTFPKNTIKQNRAISTAGGALIITTLRNDDANLILLKSGQE